MMAQLIPGDKTVGRKFKIFSTDGLVVMLKGGELNRQNVPVEIPSVQLTLDANETNYVFVDWTTEAIQSNVTGFPVNSFQLYEMVTDGSGVTDTVDRRAMARVSAHSEFFTLGDYIKNDDYNVNQGWTDFDLSAQVPVGTKMVWLRVLVRDSGVPGSDIYFGLAKPGETAWSRMTKSRPVLSGEWQEYFWPIGLDADRKFSWTCLVSGTFTVKLAILGLAYGGA